MLTQMINFLLPEQALKIKKKSTAPKSDRTTNITWTEDWLQIFQEEKRLIEVINVGEIQDAQGMR